MSYSQCMIRMNIHIFHLQLHTRCSAFFNHMLLSPFLFALFWLHVYTYLQFYNLLLAKDILQFIFFNFPLATSVQHSKGDKYSGPLTYEWVWFIRWQLLESGCIWTGWCIVRLDAKKTVKRLKSPWHHIYKGNIELPRLKKDFPNVISVGLQASVLW